MKIGHPIAILTHGETAQKSIAPETSYHQRQNIMNNHNEDMLYNALFNSSLDLHISNGIATFIKYLKYNKN